MHCICQTHSCQPSKFKIMIIKVVNKKHRNKKRKLFAESAALIIINPCCFILHTAKIVAIININIINKCY